MTLKTDNSQLMPLSLQDMSYVLIFFVAVATFFKTILHRRTSLICFQLALQISDHPELLTLLLWILMTLTDRQQAR